jgi:uncharacterized protein YciI
MAAAIDRDRSGRFAVRYHEIGRRCFTLSAGAIQAEISMFVIELSYKATLAEIDASMRAHVIFLKKYYAAHHFLVSGRKIPRDGGIIIAAGDDRGQIEAIMREDPFVKRGLADVRIIQFRASQRADDIQERIDR